MQVLTEQWRETASLLRNTENLSEIHTDARANELNITMKRF